MAIVSLPAIWLGVFSAVDPDAPSEKENNHEGLEDSPDRHNDNEDFLNDSATLRMNRESI